MNRMSLSALRLRAPASVKPPAVPVQQAVVRAATASVRLETVQAAAPDTVHRRARQGSHKRVIATRPSRYILKSPGAKDTKGACCCVCWSTIKAEPNPSRSIAARAATRSTTPQPKQSSFGAFTPRVLATSRLKAGLAFPSIFGSRTRKINLASQGGKYYQLQTDVRERGDSSPSNLYRFSILDFGF